jgi:N-acyl-D-amino-acid deacylase
MDRRAFVRTAGAGMVAGPAGLVSVRLRTRDDLIIRGGTVYDGSGGAPHAADVLVAGDRIARVAQNIRSAGAEVIDARGLAVAPGFIDIHAHTDTVLLTHPLAESKLRQGVTTEVAGQDGSSVAPSSPDRVARMREQFADLDVTTLGGFFRALEAAPATVNLASMVGAGTIRGLVIGNDDRRPTADELARMVAHVEQALRDGACGLSSGLEYVPGGFATRDELATLASPLKRYGLPYATHMRNEDDSLMAAVEEALYVGRAAGVPVQISHLKAQGERNWWKADAVLQSLEKARASGIDVHHDRYPYIAYSTGLSNLFPLWSRDGGTAAFLARLRDPAQADRIEQAVRDKIAQLGSWDAVQITSTSNDAIAWARGRRLGALATGRSIEPYALLLEITFADENRTGMVGFGMSEANTAKILAHPLGMVCSDGSALAASGPLARGSPHPRSFGTFPRVLGHYVREQRVMPLETAIHKMTAMPAAKLKLEGRGRIAEQAFADIVVFDPDTVADRATFEQPFQYPDGIPHVIVNGVFALRDGEPTGARSGRVLRPRV